MVHGRRRPREYVNHRQWPWAWLAARRWWKSSAGHRTARASKTCSTTSFSPATAIRRFQATEAERAVLGNLSIKPRRRTDASLMPRPLAVGAVQPGLRQHRPRRRHLQPAGRSPRPVFVTLNYQEPAADTVIERFAYDHLLFDRAGRPVTTGRAAGDNRTWFAYAGYGFHERLPA